MTTGAKPLRRKKIPVMGPAEKERLAAEAVAWLLPEDKGGPENPFTMQRIGSRREMTTAIATLSPPVVTAIAGAPQRFTSRKILSLLAHQLSSYQRAMAFEYPSRDIKRWRTIARRSLHTTLAFADLIEAVAVEDAAEWETSGHLFAFAENAWFEEAKALGRPRGRGICDEDPETLKHARAFVLAKLLADQSGIEVLTKEMVAFVEDHLDFPVPLIRAVKSRRTLDPGSIQAVLEAEVPVLSDGAL